MENIDITDPNFSLGSINLDSNNTVIDYDNSLFMYIGLIVFLLFSGFIFYKYYQNKKTNNEDDQVNYSTGFCNMDNNKDVEA